MADPSVFQGHLTREFRLRPRGRHSPALHHLLSVMRLPENCLDLMIVETVPFREWALAIGGTVGKEPILLDERYSSIADADWAIFKRRWIALGGPTEVLDP